MLSSKFTFDYFGSPSEQQTNSGNQMYYTDPNYPDGNVGGSTPTWRKRKSDGLSAQLDNMFSFKTGPVRHKFLITLDYTHKKDSDRRLTTDTGSSFPSNDLSARYIIRDKNDNSVIYPLTLPLGPRSTGVLRWNTAAQSATQPIPQYSYYEGEQLLPWPHTDYSFWFPTYDDYSRLYVRTSNDTIGKSDDYGVFASERATFFDGRLMLLVGGRFDQLQNNFQNRASTDPAMRASAWDDHAFTYQAGLTGYATRNIILFANASSAYNPNMQVVSKRVSTVTYDDDGYPTGESDVRFLSTVLPNEEGDGYEFGTRFVLFKDRLNITASRFVINRDNKVDSYTNEFGISEYVGNGSQQSKGYEVEFNWAVTGALQVNGAYGYNDTRYTRNSLAYLVGAPTAQNAKNNYSLLFRYRFRNGALKGLSVQGGVRYYDRSLINVGSGGLITTNPYATGSYKPLLRNARMGTGVLPFPTLPEGLVILSRTCTVSRIDGAGKRVGGEEPTGAINPNTGALMVNNQLDKGFTPGVNIPSDWISYTGQPMEAGRTYYIIDGDGQTSASYIYKANIDDNRANVYNRSYAIYNIGASYTFKTGSRCAHALRFNISNLFDKFYTYGNGVRGYGREFSVGYSVDFR
ncbi:TonB-dependent receptor [Termitidicoccus mucosus]|uniref:TonB-dependent receptor-like beta-barrel domain-containing protein n=1 Tax=Termitidicoccus mucosus TaxID=1184151 RepID=A0A178IG75_9BACT|nr:hypothetical protein AW736_16010 [Opitutaceae bacterium TSB47]